MQDPKKIVAQKFNICLAKKAFCQKFYQGFLKLIIIIISFGLYIGLQAKAQYFELQ